MYKNNEIIRPFLRFMSVPNPKNGSFLFETWDIYTIVSIPVNTQGTLRHSCLSGLPQEKHLFIEGVYRCMQSYKCLIWPDCGAAGDC